MIRKFVWSFRTTEFSKKPVFEKGKEEGCFVELSEKILDNLSPFLAGNFDSLNKELLRFFPCAENPLHNYTSNDEGKPKEIFPAMATLSTKPGDNFSLALHHGSAVRARNHPRNLMNIHNS